MCQTMLSNYLNCIIWFLLEPLGEVVMIICILVSTTHIDNKYVGLG